MNAAEILLAVGDAGAEAIVCGDESVSYGELRRRVAAAAGAWRALGLGTGARVAVWAPDSIDWVVAYLGAIWAGGVAVGINPRLPVAELLPILAESEVRHVWCDDGLSAELVPIAPSDVKVVCAEALAGSMSWPAALAAAQPMAPAARDPEEPALWIGTSGTTGIPKGVVHAQRTVIESDAFARELLGVTAADRLYATSKLFFAYALGNALFAGLRRGATVILDREWPTPERVEQMVAAHRPTVLFSVPTLYHKMHAAGSGARLAAAGIRRYVSAGEALPPTLRLAWREAAGAAPISGYGTSETLCLMLYSDDDSGRMRPTPLTEVRYDEQTPSGQPQRIWIKAGTVAKGYWRRPEAEADGFRDGWFSPGDAFLCGPGGSFEYAGRSDDMLKIAGQWVSTLWVEQALAAACGDSLQQIAAVGVTTTDGLGALAVLAVPTQGEQAAARARIAAGIEAMPGHRRPRWVHWVDGLPLTATGKTQRSALRALHEVALTRRA
jgi:acyl-coenzyme A synthetase/AMP-(fatty) acid ligase